MLEFLHTYLFHWMPEKAIWIGGQTLSWDARCAGIYIGFGLGVVYQLALDKKAKMLPPLTILVAASLLFVPLFLDVLTIKYGLRPPSNDWRFLTGLLFGQAFSVYLYPAFIRLALTRGSDRAALSSFYRLVGLLIVTASGFLAKSLENTATYYVLESLAIWGCVSLFTIIGFGLIKYVGVCGVNRIGAQDV